MISWWALAHAVLMAGVLEIKAKATLPSRACTLRIDRSDLIKIEAVAAWLVEAVSVVTCTRRQDSHAPRL
jgi:hypothetical protein